METNGKAGGDQQDGSPNQQQAKAKARAAQALSTLGGAAFVTDGVGREIANFFQSDGIFF